MNEHREQEIYNDINKILKIADLQVIIDMFKMILTSVDLYMGTYKTYKGNDIRELIQFIIDANTDYLKRLKEEDSDDQT